MSNTAALLRAYREERLFSQCALAKAAGVRQSTISRCESGDRLPSRASMEKLARALELTPEQSFEFLLSADYMPIAVPWSWIATVFNVREEA